MKTYRNAGFGGVSRISYLYDMKAMFSVPGIYDGKKIYPTEAINNHKKYKVIITFVEELDLNTHEDTTLRDFGTNMPALAFWKDEKEDLYQDYLQK